MAIKYIKLGSGTILTNRRLGIFLNPYNAVEVDEMILNHPLYAYLKSGYIVETSESDYQIRKLSVFTQNNIPLNVSSIGNTINTDSVKAILSSPPNNPVKFDRYIIGLNPTGVWVNAEDQIAEWDGITWVYSKPTENLIIPIDELGVAATFYGTYPSGTWNLPNTKILSNTFAAIDSSKRLYLPSGIKYFKLGTAKLFIDTELNLMVTKTTAAEVDASLIVNKLFRFFLSGFLVEISKVEYDDFKLKSKNARNIPLSYKEVGQEVNINAIEGVLAIPPNNPSKNIRYLVDKYAQGAWATKDDYLAQWSGSVWEFTKPENGMYVPIYSLGISTEYTGTYPSGYWNVTKEEQDAIDRIDTPQVVEDEKALELYDDLLKAFNALEEKLNAKVEAIKIPAILYNTAELLQLAFQPGTEIFNQIITPILTQTIQTTITNNTSTNNSTQVSLKDIVFKPNYLGLPTNFITTAGYLESSGVTYEIPAFAETLFDDNARYIYIKCEKLQPYGEVLLTTELISEDEEFYYNFLVGVLHTSLEGVRGISLTFGTNTIDGKFITNGIITSQDGTLWFNLNTAEASGKFTFGIGTSGYANIIDKPDLSIYVPYTGATANLDLAAFELWASKVKVSSAPVNPTDVVRLSDLTGLTGYIQNQSTAAQTGSLWITGDIKSETGVHVNGVGNISVANAGIYSAIEASGFGIFYGAGINYTQFNHSGIDFTNVNNSGFAQYIRHTALSPLANQTIYFPNGSGTLALLTDISAATASYVLKSGDTMTGDLKLPVIPEGANSAITKSYLDNALTGINWKTAVRVATTANITLSGLQTIDGVALVAGNRVLVKNQTNQLLNGVYVVASGAWTRAIDVDSSAEVETATVAVTVGTLNKNTQWTCSATDVILGTTNITFAQISGAGTYTSGTGLTLTGNVFAIDTTVLTQTGAQTLTNKIISGASNTITGITDAALTSNVALLDRTNQIFTGLNTMTGGLVLNNIAGAVAIGSQHLTGAPLIIGGDAQSPLRVLRNGGQPNIFVGTNSQVPNVSSFLMAFRTGAYYNIATPTYSGDFGFMGVDRGNDWGAQTLAANLRMNINFILNGSNGRKAVSILPLPTETSTNTDYLVANNLVLATNSLFGTIPTARLHIIGDQATSATNAINVTNSALTQLLKLTDDGQLVIGTTAPDNINKFQVTGDSKFTGLVEINGGVSGNATLTMKGNAGVFQSLYRYSDNATRPRFELYKARGTITTPLVVSSNDELGSLDFYSYDGAAHQRNAIILVQAASVATGVVTPRMMFGIGGSDGANDYYLTINPSGVVIGPTSSVITPLASLHVNGTGYFTGVLTILTAAPSTSTTQAASTAFVTTADNLKANLAGANFTGAIDITTAGLSGAILNVGNSINSVIRLTNGNANYWQFQNLQSDNNYRLQYNGATVQRTNLTGQTFFGSATSPTAFVHITAGTATAGTAPIKLTAGPVLSVTEAGAIEFDGTHFWGTVGSIRYQLEQASTLTAIPTQNLIGRYSAGTGAPENITLGTGLSLSAGGILTTSVAQPNVTSVGTSLGIGTTGPTSSLHISIDGQPSMRMDGYSNTPSADPQILFTRNRGTSAGILAVVSGDELGRLIFRGYSVSNAQAASINATVDGVVGSGIVPGRLAFFTMNSAGTVGERMRLSSSGNFLIGSVTDDATNKLQVTGSSKFTGAGEFTGILTILTASANTNTTQAASTAFVTTADNLKANIASPTFTGTVIMPTGTATVGALRLPTGVNLTTPIAGTIEFDGIHFYGTVGSTRYQLEQAPSITAVPTQTLIGRYSAGTGTPENITLGAGLSLSGAGSLSVTNALTVTTNANLTGPITSIGNTTSIASQTGTGTTFAMSASPTFTGIVTTPDIVINKTVGNSRDITWQSSGSPRWTLRTNGTAEAGGDAGSNLTLMRFNDAGVFISSLLTFTRSSGDALFSHTVTATTFVGPLTGNASTATTAGTVTTAAQPNITSVGTLTSLTSSGVLTGANLILTQASGNTRDISFQSASSDRWKFRVSSTAEAGSNSGSDFQFNRYTDGGALLGTTFGVSRASGIVTFENQVNATTFVGALTGNASTSNTAGTVTVAAQPNITSVGVLTGLTVTATITGSITGNAGTVTNGAYINATQSFTGINTFTTSASASPINAVTTTAGGYPINVKSTATTGASSIRFDDLSGNYCGLIGYYNTGAGATAADKFAILTNGKGLIISTNNLTTAHLTMTTGGLITTTGSITSPNFIGALNGNADTATILQTARTINGVSFNGSANITVPSGNLTGPITSVGNATTIASQTGTGSTFVMSVSPTITGDTTFTNNILHGNGTADTRIYSNSSFPYGIMLRQSSGTIVSLGANTTGDLIVGTTGGSQIGSWSSTGAIVAISTITGTRLISTIATGTAPLGVTSTTMVTNLNADYLDGQHGVYYAPIASPAFTGAPNLPTGTIGVTQIAGTNTTALATTAFVQSAMLDYVTIAGGQTITGTKTFTQPVTLDQYLTWKYGTAQVIGQLSMVNFSANNYGQISLFTTAHAFSATISMPFTALAASAVYYLPLTSGNLALTSDITGTNSGTNTGDNAVNTLYSGLVSNATHTGDATGSTALTVVRINGVQLSGLATGILKNTTGTGAPSIAVAADFPTLNQNTTGTAATVTTAAQPNITSVGTLTGLTVTATITGSITGNAGTSTILATARTIGITGDAVWTSPAFNGSGNVTSTIVVSKVNGVAFSGLATGILKNTTATGVPSIAVAADFPTLNQSTTGNALTSTTSTHIAGGLIGSIPYQTAVNTTALLATGTSGQVLKSNGSAAPAWQTLDMTYLPEASYKKSVRLATTTDLGESTFAAGVLTGYSATSVLNVSTTLGSTQGVTTSTLSIKVGATISGNPDIPVGTTVVSITNSTMFEMSAAATATTPTVSTTFTQTIANLTIDGFTVALNDRILVKDQTLPARNGIYYVSTLGTTSIPWVLTRVPDADTSTKISTAIVGVDTGTLNGAYRFAAAWRTSYTINSTTMIWTRVYDYVMGAGLTTVPISNTLHCAAEAITGGKMIAISNPTGGQYKSNLASENGAIKIQLPSNSATMYSIKGTIYNYTTNSQSCTFLITCYAGSMGNGYSATFTGRNAENYTVRWYTNSTIPAIYIGELTNNWSYLGVTIDEIQASYTGATLAVSATNWIISLEATAFAGTLSATQTNTRPYSNIEVQPLTGYVVGANTAIGAATTVLDAFELLQGQMNARATLASPTFTGVPLSPTAAVNTNTTQLATTAFVLGQVATVAPLMDGVAAVGTSLLYARQDHVHASDTTKANLASPTFTGTLTTPIISVTGASTLTGSVGIGMTSNAKLSIQANANTSAGGIRLMGFTTGTDINYWSETQFAMQYGGVYKNLISSVASSFINGGNLSVGTATDDGVNKFQVTGASKFTGAGEFTGSLTAPTFIGALTGNASTVTTNANLTGEATSSGSNAVTLTNSAVIGKVLTGYVSSSGTVAATDTLLQAIQKLNGNDALKAALASPTFTGTPSLPTGTIGVTQSAGNNTTALATTAFVEAARVILAAADALKAPLASPTFTGTVTAPAITGTLTGSASLNLLLTGGTLTGILTAGASINSTKAATNTVQPDNGTAAIQIDGGYSAIRSAVDRSFNIDVYNANVPINALKITQSGNTVLAGTLTATAGSLTTLALTGTITTSGTEMLRGNTGASYISGWNAANTVRSGYLQFNDANLALSTDLAIPIYLRTSNATRVTINSDGSVLFAGQVDGVTATAGDNTTKFATTAYVTTAANLKANLASPTLTGVPLAPTAAPGTNTTQIATTAFVTAAVAAGTAPYKVYTAVISQVTTGAPTVVVLQNTLGGTPTWARSSVGQYTCTLTSAFVSNKTWCEVTMGVPWSGLAAEKVNTYLTSTSVVSLATVSAGALTDGVLGQAFIEIRVYN